MHPAISYELAKARIAGLRHQAQRDALARAVTRLSWSALRSHRNQIPSASTRRSGRIQRQLVKGMADNDSRTGVISRQAIAGVPMTRHQPASGHRPGQQWPWSGAEEPR
jgi:hypothetical protein